MIFLHLSVVSVLFCFIEDIAQFLHPTCKWKCVQTHSLTFYRKRLICISNSEILSLFHLPFSMSSSWLWWWNPQHSAPLLTESSNGSQSGVSTAEANTLLASPFTSRNRRILRWRNQCLYCKWYHSSFLQGAKLLYNDYIEEYLRQRGWSNAKEMKTESRSWHFILHYSSWDRRHKYSKLPVRVSSS